MSDEILIGKAQSIERCIRRVREEYVGHEAALETDITRQDSILLNLQRACEQTIDMANRMIRLARLGYPKDSRDSFALLAQAGIVRPEIAASMQAMVGFRNIAVHEYRALDITKVRLIIDRRLDDLLAFSGALLRADPTD